MTGPFYLHPAIGCSLKTDRDCLVVNVARQLHDDVGVVTIEAVRDAKHPGKPLHKRTPVSIERREPLVPGLIRQRLGVITGYEGAHQSILLVKTRNIELQDQIAAQFVVLPRHSP